jgi:uncharacterized repeat protein (TIGR01451 family)
MATFTNQATLSYNNTTTSSNVVTGQLLEVLSAAKTAVTGTYAEGEVVTYILSIVNSGAVSFTGLTVTDDLGGYSFAGDTLYPLDYIPGSLISVTLLEGCGDIPANAFFACDAIREVRLPAGVTAIGRRAFYGCEHLVAMNLPDSVTEIGDDAFHGCVRLADFRGGANLATLGIQAFMDCVSLKTVTLPDTVTSLPNACFAGCVSLESLTADGVKSRGKQVFRHCARLGLPWVNPESVASE